MTLSPRRIATLLVALALCVAATGCAAKPADSPGTTAPQAKVVKIGFAAPLTGDNAIYGQGMQRAVQLAIEEANGSETAKAKGITFEIRPEDDAGDPKQAVNVANALIGDKSVLGVVGHFNSGCSIPASRVYNGADVAMVSVSSNPQLTAQGYGVVNRVVAKDDAQGAFAGKLAGTMGFKKVAVVNDSTPYGQGLATEFKKAAQAGGMTIVADERIQPKEVDFSALVTKLKGVTPDVIYYAGAHTEGALITKQAKEAGMKAPVMGGDMLYTPEYIKIAGAKNAEGAIATALGLPLDQQPKGAEFLAKYKAKFNKDPEAYDSYAYDCANVIIGAVLSGASDRAAVVKAVRTGSIDGVTGVIAFDANGDNKQQIISAYKVQNGKWTQIKQ
jgi:branched-chain amino acid transport system substrate-binding protein